MATRHKPQNPLVTRFFVTLSIFILLCGTVWGCSSSPAPQSSSPSAINVSKEISLEDTQTAIFAGGCFWCMEKPYDELPGVISTTSGYTGGSVENPSYQKVSSGGTGHFEAMKVVYDPNQVNYETLLDVFWRNIDPLDNRGQFCDKGSQYLSAIFVDGPEQMALAEASKEAVSEKLSDRFNQPIATEILPAATFYDAEDYHQNYYEKNPVRYKFYRAGCGRDNRLATVWGSDAP
ncbi:MAG: peptide-methionine (S)-S-oxide reductase MsrA [Cyanobacteria bacterium P01_D01_bin.105]